MGKDKFNPYNFNQYSNLPKSVPDYDPSRALSGPDIRGQIAAHSQAEYDRIRKEAEDAMHREIIYNTRNGTIYPNLDRAWRDADGIEDQLGQPPCRRNYDP